MASLHPANLNGRTSGTAIDPLATLLNLRSGALTETDLFALFAMLSKEAGRDDLHQELLGRASGGQGQTVPLPTMLNSSAALPALLSDADRLLKDGCRLICERKLKYAIIFYINLLKITRALPQSG